MKRYLLLGLGIIILAGAAWRIVPAILTQDHLSKAELAIENEMWEYAREKLDQYLHTHSSSGKAHFMMAEALVRDESISSVESAEQAIEHLETIKPGDPLYVDAQLKTARLRLFTLRMPAKAEAALRSVLDSQPDSQDGNYLMWKVLDLTGRSYAAGEYFWKVWEQTEPEFRGPRLREWYMSQFFPATANPDIFNNMAFEPLPDIEDEDLTRLLHFFLAEREEPLNHAALAKWYLEDKNPEGAIRLMTDSAKELEDEATEPLFLSVLIRCYLDAGNFEMAEKIFDQWPESSRVGYDYLVTKAMVHDRCRQEYEEAAEAYAEAIATDWPGPVEWQLRNRYANCLDKIGRKQEAIDQRKLATRIADMMTPETHIKNRNALRDVTNGAELTTVQRFYEDLGCDREAAAWRQVIGNLKKDGAKSSQPLETAP